MSGTPANNQAPTGCVNLGLIGVGRWGTRYASTLPDIDGVNLSLVVSRNPATRDMVAPDCKIFHDWRDALDSEALDGLIVATPPETHYEIASACCALGIALLIEKPLTLSSTQARELQRQAKQRGLLIMVDHTHLFSSAYGTLKVLAPTLGKPLRIYAVGSNNGPFREDVDALWDYGPHDVSMCLDLLGQDPVAIRAQLVSSPPATNSHGMLVEIRLEFSDGSEAEITVGNLAQEKQRRFEVRGVNGSLVYDDLAQDKLVAMDLDGRRTPLRLDQSLPLTLAIKAFRDAIANGETEHCSFSL
ncbi:MAG: Gfo/Idh/MocA family oxidoreductase, partial [Gammaproteobacteria bacterium]|nr:Gfo/Idh/MocA family oxidoreductase [Gammaproteobacteria bacterium]